MTAALALVASAIPAARGADCVLVAIDGSDAAGKTTFADALAVLVSASGRPTARVSVDDFHNPAALRYRRGRDSATGFWLDAFDYPLLRRLVLEPLGPGGSRHYRPRARSADRELAACAEVAEPGTVVIVDGLFLHRDELFSCWRLGVFLDVPERLSVQRLAARDGIPAQRAERYVQAQRLYRAACDPLARANVVVDNSDPARPVVLRAQRPY